MKKIPNPPDAVSLMTSARSFGNYDLAGALADLIDNSIKARARTVWISCIYSQGHPQVSIVDDGDGMNYYELLAAMRPASTNPQDERSPDDLGRFGWGMKSASFSQCRKLTVISRQANRSHGAEWDLDSIDNWSMGILSELDIARTASPQLPVDHGTEVQWSKCDRLSEGGAISSTAFNELVVQAGRALELVFHRFLEGKASGRPKLSIYLNGIKLEPFDPFHESHNATVPLEEEALSVNGELVRIRPFILPHFSKLSDNEHERLGGAEGFLRNQGFYVYRNHRLIVHGTWFRLAKYGELSQLVRIGIDIPNSMDEVWKITVDKSDAQLPTLLRNRLRQIVEGLRGKSSRVYRSKGGRTDLPGKVSVWSRYVRNNEVSYRINKDHPVIRQLLESDAGGAVLAALDMVERNFPVAAFADDITLRPDQISQSVAGRSEMTRLLDSTIPGLLVSNNSDLSGAIKELKKTEPFSSNWPMVEEYINKKGWK
ncbi:MAG: ATP-binding protein [Erythrobacter sp.]